MTSILKVDTIQSSGGTTGLTIDSNGYLFAKLPHFLMRNTGAQQIPTSTYTRAEFNDSVLDTHSFVDLTNNKIVFNSTTAGVYQINFGGKVNNASAARIGYWVRKEGSMNTGPYLGYFEIEADASNYAYPTYSFIYQFNDGEFLELDMYHTHGSDLNTYPQSQAIGFFMSGVRIG
jgi:hypothetical protein